MNLSPDARDALIDRAARALKDGGCVVLPTDTLYGVFVRAVEDGPDLLDEITGRPDVVGEPRMTLHLADGDDLVQHLVLDSAVARRMMDRLLPGAARILVEQPPERVSAALSSMGIRSGVVDHDDHIALRVPDHPITRQVLRRSGVACVARRIGAARWSSGDHPGIDLGVLPDDADPAPSVVIDDGPTLHSKGSTTVRLGSDGAIRVSEGGALDERSVLSHLERTVLFVCTGNTCRSPMARAIAQHLDEESRPDGISTRFESAGVAAGDGMSASPEVSGVLEEMGIAPGDHRSRALTPEMVDRAEVVYTMTASHAQAVMTLAPNSVHKVFVLDEREGVPDPIGQGMDVYRHTARRLKDMIARRLEEIRV